MQRRPRQARVARCVSLTRAGVGRGGAIRDVKAVLLFLRSLVVLRLKRLFGLTYEAALKAENALLSYELRRRRRAVER